MRVTIVGNDIPSGQEIPMKLTGSNVELIDERIISSNWSGYYGRNGRMGGAASTIKLDGCYIRGKYKEISLFIENNTDVQATIRITPVYADAIADFSFNTVNVAAGAIGRIDSIVVPQLKTPFRYFCLHILASSPTTGTIILRLEGGIL